MMDSIMKHASGGDAFGSSSSAANATQASQAGLASESVAESVAEPASDVLQRYPQLTALDGPDGLNGEERIAIYADVLAQLQRELDSSRG
ncbi:hypothetical protein [Bifidobacterium tibiigranuli]|jgi:hypothetical protein|uniref:hypothetical protein n=1 Tax=Bifidobacterium tibiigranuli TaxID=2172043 RepID=UPI0026EF78EA|nr:hypothetical protein [Bifidobacterium tibiigranuli]MCI2185279.1 hypothetical protein [Bifidobacterium tibiigranuli]MCI2203746.1 hypothetical protein [Bifidobacterium tibiigranuli]